ncbi:FecR domain-containing protein [Polynucleobacter sp. UB-Tiil-W10]|uniref:FecR family protein n=1 Tax=Polynucleobacter sp. UB-Tiil-W10 TaxID=1855648 RepID=UPI001C0DBAFF|nr:FecR family protein [Polynucleobacter sp. UB-Tiil-W10]MBU3539639.1 FecR domain-containing protein [Polynucleobacter sp. UB-Tiil-W10]
MSHLQGQSFMHPFFSRLAKAAKSVAVVTILISSLIAPVAHAQSTAEAGRVLMSIGDVKINRNGQTIPAPKNTAIQSGDTVITGIASNAQIRMSDAAVIALRAQTEFKINEYKFNGKSDGSEKANLSLVKGGVRAVTGSIGRENKDNLQVNAVVATVGIRGTGYNLNYCEGNCLNTDKTPVKDGLYAGVFEGQITIKNKAGTEALGVDQYAYVADDNSQAKRLSQPPNFLPDPLAGQKSAKPKGRGNTTDIPSLAVAVTPPAKGADEQVAIPSSPLPMMMGIVVNPSPYLATGISPFAPYASQLYNKPEGDGIAPTPASYSYYLQKAEVWPLASGGSIQPDGLPQHNILPDSNWPGWPSTTSAPALPQTGLNAITTAGSGLNTYITYIGLEYPTYFAQGNPSIPMTFAIGTAQQMEGGNLAGVVSWGRWANGNVIIADYNNGNLLAMPAGNGFHFIVGDRTNPTSLQQYLNTGPTTLNFSLVGATTPTYVNTVAGSQWAVTGGNLTANFASSQLTGNLALYTNQPTGYAFLNMNIAGSLSAAADSNTVSTSVVKTSGSNSICTAACNGSGNVVFYGNAPGNPAQAAGLSYNFSTGSNVVQGVAVFKR